MNNYQKLLYDKLAWV